MRAEAQWEDVDILVYALLYLLDVPQVQPESLVDMFAHNEHLILHLWWREKLWQVDS